MPFLSKPQIKWQPASFTRRNSSKALGIQKDETCRLVSGAELKQFQACRPQFICWECVETQLFSSHLYFSRNEWWFRPPIDHDGAIWPKEPAHTSHKHHKRDGVPTNQDARACLESWHLQTHFSRSSSIETFGILEKDQWLHASMTWYLKPDQAWKCFLGVSSFFSRGK